MRTMHRIALALVIIGAINWGLIGLFQFDLVASIFGGQASLISRIIYTLVGISSILCLPLFFEQNEAEHSELEDNHSLAHADFATEFAEEPDIDRLYNPSLEAYEGEDEEEEW
ncbi:DUF378 domain-containing protein [Bacillus niameyensis]|uniref:DUF378 domain-containing protein n=1 Tax=Bacillus niameyensis TaxID=1522308 RepID=UPI0007840427|nr:DUF378 domain-containing protein [Bacillus niameyensis]